MNDAGRSAPMIAYPRRWPSVMSAVSGQCFSPRETNAASEPMRQENHEAGEP